MFSRFEFLSFKISFQPFVITSTPKAIKDSTKVSNKTLNNRKKLILDQMKTSSGESTGSLIKQTAVIIKSFGKEERQLVLEKANISAKEITSEEMVALKADMGVPWEKLKTMSRYKNSSP